MNEIDDGGLAFPVREAERFNPENNETHAIEQHWGMSLRDYFAGQALVGLLAHKDTQSNGSSAAEFARVGSAFAFVIADAMIAARKAVKR